MHPPWRGRAGLSKNKSSLRLALSRVRPDGPDANPFWSSDQPCRRLERRPPGRLGWPNGKPNTQRWPARGVTQNYQPAALIGRQVAAAVNFPPRQIGEVLSEVLVLGFPDEHGNVVLFAPDHRVPNGARLF